MRALSMHSMCYRLSAATVIAIHSAGDIMKKVPTISLDEVRKSLRRRGGGQIENASGWCVFVDKQGHKRYVVNEDNAQPVPYRAINPLYESNNAWLNLPVNFH